MGIIKRYPLLFGFISFMVFTLPQTIASYLDLWREFGVPNMRVDWYSWLLPASPLFGVILFAMVIWQTRKPTPQRMQETTDDIYPLLGAPEIIASGIHYYSD